MIPLEVSIGRYWLTRRKYRRVLPTSWEEVPQSRLLLLMRLAYALPPEQARALALETLLQIPKKVLPAIPPLDRARMEDALQFMTVAASDKPILPWFDWNDQRYYAPAASFMNGVASEYAIADEFYKKFVGQKDDRTLLMLTATLWREAKTDDSDTVRSGDRRVRLTGRSEISHRAEALKDLPQEYQMAALLYFAGVKTLIEKTYGEFLFNKPAAPATDLDGTPLEAQPARPAKEALFGWWGIFMDVAENPIHLDKIHQMNFHTLCMYLVKRRKEQQDQELKQKMNSPNWGT